MLPTSDAVYFVEKVAFQEPYRLLKFKNRTELSDYPVSYTHLDVYKRQDIHRFGQVLVHAGFPALLHILKEGIGGHGKDCLLYTSCRYSLLPPQQCR